MYLFVYFLKFVFNLNLTLKNTILNHFRFSTGPASYFFDAIDEMLLTTFNADATADFTYF